MRANESRNISTAESPRHGNFSDTLEKLDELLLPNKNMIQQKITPCLWVEKDAKTVAEYYLSIFKDGKLKDYRLFTNMPKDGNPDNLSPDNFIWRI